MIQMCRECGVITGGLRWSPGFPEPEPWPENDLCPTCHAKTLLEQVPHEVKPVVEKESAGHH